MWIIDRINEAKRSKEGDIKESLRRIEEEAKNATPGTQEWEALRKAYEQELRNQEIKNRLRFFGIPADKLLFAGIILGLGLFAFSLDQESPAALKIAKTVCDFAKVSKG